MAHALEALFDLSPAYVRIADTSGEVLRVNRAARLAGAHAGPAGSAGSDAPRTLRALWEQARPTRVGEVDRVPFAEAPAMRALAGHIVRREPLSVLRGSPPERGLVECSATPIRDASGAVIGVVLIEEDVDDRARDRIALQEARSHDRRLSAVGKLAAGVMHDVNNALNPIMAAAYLLRHHAESPDAVRDYAERIRMAAETGAATAARVGRFIRQEPVHTGGDEPLDLSVLAAEVIDLTEPMRLRRTSESATVSLRSELAPDVRCRGMPGEIREALLNLVQNAIDAMPSGGTLTVRTFNQGDDACVSVEDDGVGMSEETREHAFEPFFTTKGSGGSGLGLAEVYGIARRHRGTASISSVEGESTLVTLRLPADRTPPSPAPTPAAAAPAAPIRILVVEDHDDGREFLRRMLESEGHSVDTAGNCADARMRLAEAGAEGYDLLLTDVGLPDGSGWDLAAHAGEELPAMRVGVITGWEPMVSSAEARGAEFVLRKPLRAAELLSHIAGRAVPAPEE